MRARGAALATRPGALIRRRGRLREILHDRRKRQIGRRLRRRRQIWPIALGGSVDARHVLGCIARARMTQAEAIDTMEAARTGDRIGRGTSESAVLDRGTETACKREAAQNAERETGVDSREPIETRQRSTCCRECVGRESRVLRHVRHLVTLDINRARAHLDAAGMNRA